MRERRHCHLTQPLAAKLTANGAVLAVLAATLVSQAVDWRTLTADAVTPTLLALGTAAVLSVGTAVAALVAVGAYRLRREPLTERQALAVLTVEDAASYLGLATGGLLVTAAVGVVAVDASAGGVSVLPIVDPTAESVAGSALAAGTVAVLTGRYLDGRLPAEE